MTIASHFSDLLKRIEPTPRDELIYQTHEKTVRRRLETVFRANRIIRVGSYSRGTSIRHTSDVDLMLILERDEIRRGGQFKTSTTVLNNVRAQLSDRYFQTNVRRDKQAVVVQFRGNQYPVDVVPAVYYRHGGNSSYPIYIIPDGNGGWLETSPLAHNKFIKDADKASKGKLKRTSKLIKYWRYCREPHVPLNSFHVELLLAHENICSGPKSYALCFNNALAALANHGCQPLDDPVGISGLIEAANTEPMRGKVQAAVLSSAQRTYNAIMAERDGNMVEALRLWEIVFNHRFVKG
jgi:predicted nucleotidyltransferase